MGKTGCEIPLIAHSDELSLMRAAVAESCGEENQKNRISAEILLSAAAVRGNAARLSEPLVPCWIKNQLFQAGGISMSCGDPLTITGVGVGIKKEFVSL